MIQGNKTRLRQNKSQATMQNSSPRKVGETVKKTFEQIYKINGRQTTRLNSKKKNNARVSRSTSINRQEPANMLYMLEKTKANFT